MAELIDNETVERDAMCGIVDDGRRVERHPRIVADPPVHPRASLRPRR